MFCPKCGTTLEDGAKFCHSCGNTVEPSANFQQQQPVTPQQPNYQQQQSNYQQPNYPQQSNQTFDINKIPLSSWLIAGIAFFGVICTFLPWITVNIYWVRTSVNGMNSIFGVFTLIVFLGISVITVFGQAINIEVNIREKILSFGAIGAGGFCLIDIIRFVAGSQGYGNPGFGLIMAFLVSVALVLFGFKVIKLK